MRLDELAKRGIPRRILEVWRTSLGDTLLPIQAEAVRRGLLGEGLPGNRGDSTRHIICGPTSCGKSFCAEMAIARALKARRRALVLVPLKALAYQYHRRHQLTFGRLGVSGIIVSGDHPENDLRLQQGNYQVAYAIYEKADRHLTRHLDALAGMGVVVVDELQTIAEPSRGAVLERTLIKVLQSTFEPSLVALSAVVGRNRRSLDSLAQWLHAQIVYESHRPVDLHLGVAAEGRLRYRSYNTGSEGEESFETAEAHDDPFQVVINRIINQPGPSLVFLKSRQDTVAASLRLAEASVWPPAARALEELEQEESSHLIRCLRAAVKKGVAFHNADLSLRQRQLIEESFAGGELQAIVCTTTLSMGIDLPAHTVFVEPVKYCSGEYGDRPSLVPVSRTEFENMSGRAGRLSRCQVSSPGQTVIVAGSELERDILWDNYIADAEPEPVQSSLETIAVQDFLLDLVVCGLLKHTDRLLPIYEGSFHARCGGPFNLADLHSSLEDLVDHQMVELLPEGSIAATELGRRTALAALTVRQVGHYAARLGSGLPQTVLGWTAVALSGPGWSLPTGFLSYPEISSDEPMRMLHERFQDCPGETGFLVGRDGADGPVPRRLLAAIKALLLMDDWSRLEDLGRLERRYRIHLGQIRSLGESVAHLLSGLSGLVEIWGAGAEQVELLRQHAFSVRVGLPASLQPLYACLGRVLNRSDFAALLRNDLGTIPKLLNAAPHDLQQAVVSSKKLSVVREIVKNMQKEIPMKSTHVDTATRSAMPLMSLSGEPELVEIDGDCQRERFLVRINGVPVPLTGKSFKYFARLAWSRVNCEPGWVYKEDLEAGFNQARYLYRMKNEIISGYNSSWEIVENNRLGYYRLSLDPSKIRFNLDNLGRHPDYEVRCLVPQSSRSTEKTRIQ